MIHPICPKCSKPYAIRISPVGIKEHLLTLFYVYPFRCQLCGCRFGFLQWGVKYQRVEEDRREHERLPVNFAVTFASHGVVGKGSVADISMSGCTIQTGTQLLAGNIIHLSLHISNELPAVTVDAAVVRNARLNRVGLEFLTFPRSERERLQAFIRSQLLARPEHPKAPDFAARAQAESRQE